MIRKVDVYFPNGVKVFERGQQYLNEEGIITELYTVSSGILTIALSSGKQFELNLPWVAEYL